MNTAQLEPGSPAAVAQGCTCPPQTGSDRICDANCPIHATADWVERCPHGHAESEDCPACNPD